jgi:hypothetical protein
MFLCRIQIMLFIKYGLVLAWVGPAGLKEWVAPVESDLEVS